ncbi:MAG TPA: GlsB/YeaQ/YmgE family stress response membrane protein [Ureibacillus sp.]|nr:GlsB/YeaQ/YmgE family stress response membrane protein [Ureibacillus sp.]
MGILWTLIVGGIIGWLAGLLTGRDVPGGIIGNIIAGFIGSWLGSLILGSWGAVIGGFAIIPAIIGSIVLVLIVSFILRKMEQKKNHGHHA